MELIRTFKLDSVENKEAIYLYIGNEQKFLNLNPFEFRIRELKEIFDLPKNWDGYDALPVFKDIYHTVKKLIVILNGDLIERIHDVYPNSHGTVTIEWINRKKEKLSLEIGKSSYSFFVEFTDLKPQFYNGQNILMDAKVLTNSLESLFGKEIPRYLL